MAVDAGQEAHRTAIQRGIPKTCIESREGESSGHEKAAARKPASRRLLLQTRCRGSIHFEKGRGSERTNRRRPRDLQEETRPRAENLVLAFRASPGTDHARSTSKTKEGRYAEPFEGHHRDPARSGPVVELDRDRPPLRSQRALARPPQQQRGSLRLYLFPSRARGLHVRQARRKLMRGLFVLGLE